MYINIWIDKKFILHIISNIQSRIKKKKEKKEIFNSTFNCLDYWKKKEKKETEGKVYLQKLTWWKMQQRM